MEEKRKILEELGLSKNETIIYISLLEIGLSSLKEITSKSGIHRTSVYDILKRLKEKGLVSYISKDDKTYYQAMDPDCLLGILKEREDKLKKIIPMLRFSQDMNENIGGANIFEGIVAVRNILNHFIELKKPRYVYGVPKIASDMIGKFFMEKHHRMRQELGLEMKHIYNSDAKDRIKFLNELDFTESRYLPKEFDSPVATSICGDEVVLMLFQEKPLVIQIKNKAIAKAYKNYFDILWKISKKE